MITFFNKLLKRMKRKVCLFFPTVGQILKIKINLLRCDPLCSSSVPPLGEAYPHFGNHCINLIQLKNKWFAENFSLTVTNITF